MKTLINPEVQDLSDLPPLFQAFLGLKQGALVGFDNEGFNDASDVITQTIDGADLNAMWREFQTTLSMHNRSRTALINRLVFGVGNPVERVMYPSDEQFEEASEFGEPKGIRLGKRFALGYDFKWYDLGIRYTWMFLAEADQEQLRALHNTALTADVSLMFDKVFRAIFNNTTRSTEINEQAIAVYPFYNADGVMVPPSFRGQTFDATHNHYLTSGAATIDSGDVDAQVEHLYHHGYRQNLGYTLILLVNRQEGDTIRGFSTTGGDKYTFIPGDAVGGGTFVQDGRIVGRPNLAGIPDAIGTYGPVVVVENDWIPAGYTIMLASGGERNIGNPVGIREHARPGLRGMQLVKGRVPDYPLQDSFYRHGLGTGVRHRGAGVVMEITADATYDPPAVYA